MRKRWALGLLAIAIAVCLVMQSCTPIGYVIGRQIDADNSTFDTVLVHTPDQLTVGDQIEIFPKYGRAPYRAKLLRIASTTSNDPDSVSLVVGARHVVPWYTIEQVKLCVLKDKPVRSRLIGAGIGLMADIVLISTIRMDLVHPFGTKGP